MASLPHTVSIEDALGVSEIARILGVHPRTIERHRDVLRRKPGRASRVTRRPLEAQREEKLHRIWRDLTAIFTPEDAVYWLQHPVPALEDRRPLDMMSEDGGLDRVLETIGRMSWGIPG